MLLSYGAPLQALLAIPPKLLILALAICSVSGTWTVKTERECPKTCASFHRLGLLYAIADVYIYSKK
jgi:hypothetical protein